MTAMQAESYPHISYDERGVARIGSTRHRVIDIAADYIAHGYGAAQIVDQYPDLTLAQVHAAFTYYFDHQEAIDAALIESYRRSEKLRSARKLHPKLVAALAEQTA